MQKDLINYLSDTCRCSKGDKYLLAVSGGVDSVVMGHLFHGAGIDFSLAHCNFSLRGQESDDDQAFVENLAAGMERQCFIKRFDTISFAETRGLSIQMAARELRYTWFQELSSQYGFDYIAVAHNRNDVVETFLLNFSRGTGIRGLTGIKPRHGKVVRPLLFATRKDILCFAEDHRLTWREDSSNAGIKYARNLIRHEVISEFEKLNPSFIPDAIETIGRLEQTEQLMSYFLDIVRNQVMQQTSERYTLDIQKLLGYPATELLLFELLRDFGCNQLDIKALIKSFGAISGKQFITRTHTITRDRELLIITRNTAPVRSEYELYEDTEHIHDPIGLSITRIHRTAEFRIPSDPRFAALDAGMIRFPLKIRTWRKGDFFRPLGMKGTKKISDFLIDQKIPLPDKQKLWLVESEGKIAWIVNHRIDDRFKITTGTSEVLLIEYNYFTEDL